MSQYLAQDFIRSRRCGLTAETFTELVLNHAESSLDVTAPVVVLVESLLVIQELPCGSLPPIPATRPSTPPPEERESAPAGAGRARKRGFPFRSRFLRSEKEIMKTCQLLRLSVT